MAELILGLIKIFHRTWHLHKNLHVYKLSENVRQNIKLCELALPPCSLNLASYQNPKEQVHTRPLLGTVCEDIAMSLFDLVRKKQYGILQAARRSGLSGHT